MHINYPREFSHMRSYPQMIDCKKVYPWTFSGEKSLTESKLYVLPTKFKGEKLFTIVIHIYYSQIDFFTNKTSIKNYQCHYYIQILSR